MVSAWQVNGALLVRLGRGPRPVDAGDGGSPLNPGKSNQFASHGDAKMELFNYIEMFYNQRRRHSTLGQISPAAFERRAATHAA